MRTGASCISAPATAGSGEQRDSRRLNPQRLDTLVGKILRIVPDLREHTKTSTVSENGRYRIPNDNPFVDGRRRAQGDLGVRSAQSASADLGRRPGAASARRRCWPSTSGSSPGKRSSSSTRARTTGIRCVRARRACRPPTGWARCLQTTSIPIQISDTVARGTVKPTYPVIQYPHNRDAGGDAIANGFVYRGKLIPALRDKLVFGDITTGRIWYANRADVLAADDGNPTTVAPIYEMDADLRRLTEETYRERGGKGRALPGMGAIAGRGRVDLRFAVDNDGELYILTKSDGMIRKVVGARARRPRRRRPRMLPRRVPVRTSPASQPPASEIPWHRRPSRSPPGSGPTTPTAPPVTGTWRRARSKPASRSPSSRSSEASSRRISPTTSGITARATARSSPSSSAGCRRR